MAWYPVNCCIVFSIYSVEKKSSDGVALIAFSRNGVTERDDSERYLTRI